MTGRLSLKERFWLLAAGLVVAGSINVLQSDSSEAGPADINSAAALVEPSTNAVPVVSKPANPEF